MSYLDLIFKKIKTYGLVTALLLLLCGAIVGGLFVWTWHLTVHWVPYVHK